MNKKLQRQLQRVAGIAALALCAMTGSTMADEIKVTLSGDKEVPPVMTPARGSGTLTINTDKSVVGSIMTTGLDGNMAHIHYGAAGTNGPVIIPLTKAENGVWRVPAGAKLTDDQFAAYKAGELYVNVHSAAHMSGEIRGQLAK